MKNFVLVKSQVITCLQNIYLFIVISPYNIAGVGVHCVLPLLFPMNISVDREGKEEAAAQYIDGDFTSVINQNKAFISSEAIRMNAIWFDILCYAK